MRYPLFLAEFCPSLGTCRVYRRFVANYLRIAAPLNCFLKNGQTSTLLPRKDAQAFAFKTPIEAISLSSILSVKRPEPTYSVDTDTCDHQLEAGVFQTRLDGERKHLGLVRVPCFLGKELFHFGGRIFGSCVSTPNITSLSPTLTLHRALGPGITKMANRDQRAVWKAHAVDTTAQQLYIRHCVQKVKPQHSCQRALPAYLMTQDSVASPEYTHISRGHHIR